MNNELRVDTMKHFEGKTILRVDCSAVNMVVFHFTDNTSAALETEHMGHGIYGIVPCAPAAEDLVERSLRRG